MNGIEEKQFLYLCEGLHNALLKEVNGEKNDDVPSIEIFAGQIIDESHGFIITDNEKTKLLFQEVFNAARGIIQYTRYTNHYRAALKNKTNDRELEEASSMFVTNRRLLLNSYKKALEATGKLLDPEKTI